MSHLAKWIGMITGTRRRRWNEIQRIRAHRAHDQQWDAIEQELEGQLDQAGTIEERLEIRKLLWVARCNRTYAIMTTDLLLPRP